MGTEYRIVREGPVTTLVLNRPEVRNAVTPAIARALADHLKQMAEDSSCRVMVLTGEGNSFCSGADLAHGGLTPGDGGLEGVFRDGYHNLIEAITGLPKPVIAKIRGPAVGFGLSLALACDFRIAAESASFAMVFPKIGLLPDGGATYLLPRLVGLTRALEMILTAEKVGALKAEEVGLITRAVPDPVLDGEVANLADRLASLAPMALAAAKRTVLRNLSATLAQSLETEMHEQIRLLGSEDFSEGISAFLKKRTPEFKGR